MGRPDEEKQDEQGHEEFHQPSDHQEYKINNNNNQSSVESTPPPPYPPPPPPAPYQNEPQYQMPQPPPFQPFYQNPPVYQQPQQPSFQPYNQNPPQMPPSPPPAVGYPQIQQNVGTERWNTELFGCLEDPQNGNKKNTIMCVL